MGLKNFGKDLGHGDHIGLTRKQEEKGDGGPGVW